jgi:hypothetical protein
MVFVELMEFEGFPLSVLECNHYSYFGKSVNIERGRLPSTLSTCQTSL